MDRKRKRGVRQLGRGVLAGALGGLIGGWTMGRSAALWEKLSGKPDGVSRSELARLEARQFVSGSSQELDSISKVADWIDARLFRHGLSPTQKGIAAALVHYSAGAALGAVYGALAEVAPGVTKGWGVPFGVAESLTIESAGASIVGLTRRFLAYSPREHAQSIFDHAVYGFTLECTRRAFSKS